MATTNKLIASYLQEFPWRKKFDHNEEDTFITLLQNSGYCFKLTIHCCVLPLFIFSVLILLFDAHHPHKALHVNYIIA